MLPKGFKYALLVLMLLALVPPALIARARVMKSSKTRIHLIQDMDDQPKYKTQTHNSLFEDRRAMRPVVPGTVARGELWEDDHHFRGLVNGQWATTFPTQLEVNPLFLQRGQDRFTIYCTPCHGQAGYGDGMINQRGMALTMQGVNGSTWVAAKSLHEETIRTQPPGQIFSTVTNGIRNMAGYASQIPVDDRWAIVAYVKALQLSQNPDALSAKQ